MFNSNNNNKNNIFQDRPSELERFKISAPYSPPYIPYTAPKPEDLSKRISATLDLSSSSKVSSNCFGKLCNKK